MYKYLLFDADNTLLDFDAAEKAALKETLVRCPLGFSEEIYERYHVINDIEWKKLEKGETTRDKLRIDRFMKLLLEYGIDGDIYGELCADTYTQYLSKQGQLLENAEKVLSCLSKKYDCYICTNGITDVQMDRLEHTPLLPYVKKVFVSEDVGFAKPSPMFFQRVFEYIGDNDPKNYLVIGDSLSSDIAGANSCNMDSVWISDGESDLPTYRIGSILDIYSILD